MELKKYMRLLWRWWWVVVLGTGLAAFGAYTVSQRSAPVYEASTALLINQAATDGATPDYSDVQTAEHLAKTYAELLRKRPVLEAVIANLGLTTSVSDLEKRVRVDVVRDTLLILVSVEDTDPARAAAIVNEMSTVFGQQSREMQASRYAALKQTLETKLAEEQAVIDEQETKLAMLSRDVLRSELIRVRSAVDRAQADLQVPDVPRQVLLYQLSQIRNDLEGLQSNRDTVAALGSDQQIAQQTELRTHLQQHQSNYTSLLRNLEEVRLAEAQTNSYLSVAEAASAPTLPIRPRVALNVLLAAILGALLTLGLAFLVEFFDNSVRTRDEVEQMLGVPTLASIARIRGIGLPNKLVTARSAGSPITEAYRILRTNIEFAEVDKPIRTMVVTSSATHEGKSTTAANLAVTVAQTGKRVALVDLDLRGPTLHQFFKLNNQRGVTTALLHPEENVGEYLLPTGVENLSLIPSGPLPSNPAELLGSQRMGELIEELKEHADLVIFDSSPMLTLADATILARRCDAALLVAQAGSTRVDALRRVRDQLAQSGVRTLGIVLNRVSTSPIGDHYYSRRLWRGQRLRPQLLVPPKQ